MFFDKSERACNGPLTHETEPLHDDPVTTASKNSPVKHPGAGKPRFKVQETTLLGPGTYYHQTTLIKPSFNKLMSDHTELRKSIDRNDAEEGFSVAKGRSSLTERRALKSSLQDILRKGTELHLIQTEIGLHHATEMKVQNELQMNRKKQSSLCNKTS